MDLNLSDNHLCQNGPYLDVFKTKFVKRFSKVHFHTAKNFVTGRWYCYSRL